MMQVVVEAHKEGVLKNGVLCLGVLFTEEKSNAATMQYLIVLFGGITM